MNLKRLAAPIIAYWDLSPGYPLSGEKVRMVCEDLLANKILVLNLWDSSPDIGTGSLEILKRLGNENINITLTLDYSAWSGLNAKGLWTALKRVLIQVKSPDHLLAKIKSSGKNGPSIGISFELTEANLKNIPGLLRHCLNAGIRDVYFPIQRPAKDRKIFWSGAEQNRLLSEEMKGIKTDDLNIVIHDPFFWKVFHEGSDHNEGCQGANNMIYISPSFDVTPCPLLPVAIGNLSDSRLKEILSSESRHKIREALTAIPDDCKRCRDVARCRGGCRGRTYVCEKTFNMPDPACILVPVYREGRGIIL